MEPYVSSMSPIHDGLINTTLNAHHNQTDYDLSTANHSLQLVLEIIYVTITLAMSIVGVVGNAFVLGALLVHRKLRVLGNSFIANLAVVDMCISTIIDPCVAVGVFTNGTFFLTNDIICEIAASVCMVACSCSLWSICLLSINRYLCICHNRIYCMIYTKQTVPLMLLMLWIYCFLLDLPNFFGWGNHAFDSKGYFCSYDYRADYTYTLFFIVVAIGTPMVLVTYCYVQIIRFVNDNKRKMKINMKKQNALSASRMRHTDMRLLKSVATIWLVFTSTWFPYGILILLSSDNVPQWLYLLSIILAHSNSSMNWAIYAATNKNFRTAYRIILHRIFTVCFTAEKKKMSKGMFTTVSERSARSQLNKLPSSVVDMNKDIDRLEELVVLNNVNVEFESKC